MIFNKQNLSALSIALLMGFTHSSVSYAEVGAKIKNATHEEVKQALTDTLKATEAAISALKDKASEDVVQEHISKARQAVKGVEINRLDVIRTRSSEKLKSARHALSKGEQAEAEAYLSEAYKGFQEMERQF